MILFSFHYAYILGKQATRGGTFILFFANAGLEIGLGEYQRYACLEKVLDY